MSVRRWRKGALCTVGLPCRPAGPGMAPFCGLPTPIPCSLPECGCPGSRGLHQQGSVPWASPLHSSASPPAHRVDPRTDTRRSSCAHVIRCPLLPGWTPAASPLDGPLSPLGTRRRDGGLGPFSSPHSLQHPCCCSPASGSSL